MGLWGGIAGLRTHSVGGDGFKTRKARRLKDNVKAKLLSFLPPKAQPARWRELWQAIVDDLHTSDLLSNAERTALLRSDVDEARRGTIDALNEPANREARRRLHFFAHSLEVHSGFDLHVHARFYSQPLALLP